MNSEWVNEDGRLVVSLRAHRGREEGANLGIYQAWRHKFTLANPFKIPHDPTRQGLCCVHLRSPELC